MGILKGMKMANLIHRGGSDVIIPDLKEWSYRFNGGEAFYRIDVDGISFTIWDMGGNFMFDVWQGNRFIDGGFENTAIEALDAARRVICFYPRRYIP